MKKISMQNIADELGISKVTVYRALKDKYGVSEEMKLHIENYAKSVGYDISHKNAKRIKHLVFVIARPFYFDGEEFYHSIFAQLQKACQAANQEIKVYKISQKDDDLLKIPDSIVQGKIDGIFLGQGLSAAYINALQQYNLPTVALDFDFNGDSILIDNYALGRSATELLIKNGHRTIGFVGDPKTDQNILDRFFGYRRALFNADIDFLPEWQTSNNDIKTELYSINFPLPTPLPTAFICYCDCAAYYLIERLKIEKKRIPEEVSIISFDNTSLASKTTPNLTSINVDRTDFANQALFVLMQRAANPKMNFQTIYMRGTIIERDSLKNLEV